MPDQPYFNLNKILHVWVERLLFIWLPIYAIFHLSGKFIKSLEAKKDIKK